VRIRLSTVNKILGFILGGLAAVSVGAALFVWISFDAQQALDRITQAVHTRYDRTLRADEAPRFSLWPWPAVELRKVTLSEAHRQDVFATVDEARLELSLAPLLMREAIVRRMAFDGLDARLRRDTQGNWNVADLFADGTEEVDETVSARLHRRCRAARG
jgi:AsmA protein